MVLVFLFSGKNLSSYAQTICWRARLAYPLGFAPLGAAVGYGIRQALGIEAD